MAKNGQKWPKMAKNGHVLESRKVGESNSTPTKLFLLVVMKSMPFKFGNDIFITFEMSRVAYNI
jgi:hypothetical protein